MRYLKADTAVVVAVGPMVAIADGFTTVDAATVTAIDCGIKKAGTAGAAISLTASGGANDMVPTANNPGHYDMELPAADVNLEGPLRYTFNDVDVCLPFWEDFMVVNANVYDSLFAAAATDYLQVDTFQVAGSAALAAIEGEVDDALIAQNLDHLALTPTAAADMTAEVADDTILSRLLAAGDTSVFVPSTDSLDALRIILDEVHLHTEAIAVTGSALTQIAGSDTLAVGTETSGTYVSTHLADAIEHVITVAAAEIDIYYEFDIGESGVPVAVHGEGWLEEGPPAGGDTIDMYAYNWGTGFELVQADVFTGVTAKLLHAFSHTLLARHVGTGGNEGLVRIRFQAASLEAGTTLNIDQMFISYAEAIAADLAKVPKSDGTVIHNATALAAIADGVFDEQKTGHTAGGSFGEEIQSHSLSSEIAALQDLSDAEVWAFVIENSKAASVILRLAYAVLCNKSSGGGTSTAVFRDDADSKNRISATVDGDGNRTAIGTKDGS